MKHVAFLIFQKSTQDQRADQQEKIVTNLQTNLVFSDGLCKLKAHACGTKKGDGPQFPSNYRSGIEHARPPSLE